MPVNSPAAGVIEELLVEDGTTVKAHQPLFKLRVGASGGSTAPKAPKAEQAKEPAAEKATEKAAIPDSPPPSSRPPSAPIGHTPAAVKAPSAQSSGSGAAPAAPGSRTETRVKINRMRLRIAQRLKEAQNTYAMLTTFNEIDMTLVTANVNLRRVLTSCSFQKCN